MSAPEIVLVAATVVTAIVLIVLFVVRNTPPRGNSTGQEPRDTDNDRFYRGADRPAGPDAEDSALDPASAAAPDDTTFREVRRR